MANFDDITHPCNPCFPYLPPTLPTGTLVAVLFIPESLVDK